MKFTCERSILLKEIAIAQEVVPSRNVLSSLSNISLEGADNTLYIKATDTKVTFETKLPVTLEEEGETLINGEKFLEILNSVPEGEIDFAQTEQKINIRHEPKKIRYQLKCQPSDQYPELPVAGGGVSFEVPIKEFKDMIEQTIFSVSDDETRFFMNGVFFERQEEKLIMVATDGRRMAYIAKEIPGLEDFKGVIIPPKMLNLILKRAGDEGLISITVTDRIIFVKFGSYNLSSVLIEGNFPNYRRVIPENQENSFVINRVDILNAFKSTSPFVEKSGRIFLGVSSETMSISSGDGDIGTGQQDIPCRYEGDGVTIALNYHYLEEPFKVMKSDEVEVLFNDTGKALTIRPLPESDFFHVVMPMQQD